MWRRIRNASALVAPALVAALLALFIHPQPPVHAAPIGFVDQPVEGAQLSGAVDIVGWAVDDADHDSAGIDRVTISIDEAYVTDAALGDARPDIASAFGPQFGKAGFHASLDIQSLASPGTHQLIVRAHSRISGDWATMTRTVQILAAPRFGINAHLLWFGHERAAADIDRIKGSGLSVTRFDVSWDNLEPDGPASWNDGYVARLDDALQLASDRGLHAVVTVLRTPGWARSGGSPMSPPDDPNAYADVLGRLAARYANMPGLTWEVWNEPNSPVFWDAPGGIDPVRYTALLSATYHRIKAVAPSTTVLGGSLAFNDPGYLRAMLAAGAGDVMDGLAIHPYSRAHAPDDASVPQRSFGLAIAQFEQVLSDDGYGDVPIWITEMGWSTEDVSDDVRATYYRRAVEIVRADPRIAAFVAFELNQNDDSTGPHTGLVTPDGGATASWSSYRQAVTGK